MGFVRHPLADGVFAGAVEAPRADRSCDCSHAGSFVPSAGSAAAELVRCAPAVPQTGKSQSSICTFLISVTVTYPSLKCNKGRREQEC